MNVILYNPTAVRISAGNARERLADVVEMSQSQPVELQPYRQRADVGVGL